MSIPMCQIALIEGLGGPELMMIMFVILLLFGADRMPGLARGIGKSMREFKKAASGVENEFRKALDDEPAAPKRKATSSPPGSVPNSPPAADKPLKPDAPHLSEPPEI